MHDPIAMLQCLKTARVEQVRITRGRTNVMHGQCAVDVGLVLSIAEAERRALLPHDAPCACTYLPVLETGPFFEQPTSRTSTEELLARIGL